MCGVAGMLSFGARAVTDVELEAMAVAISHRGPDGQGVLNDAYAGLAHRRLSILDLTAASSQPMVTADGRWAIAYNGEVYNFLELREELRRQGHHFDSSGDTEVVLKAFVQWGVACLDRFNGMWAFAVLDRLTRTVTLARDRFGVKPLFYCREAGRLTFASEIKAILAVTTSTPPENENTIAEYLAGAPFGAGDETAYEGVHSLLPGHVLTANAAGFVNIARWWQEEAPEIPTSPADQVDRYRELLVDSCRLRLRSDVPAATLLSGGVDSAAIACIVARLMSEAQDPRGVDRRTPECHRAFTAVFPGTSVDESRLAGQVATAAGLRAVKVHPSTQDIGGMVCTMIREQDAPVDQSLFAVSSVYATVSQHEIALTLDGQGADEALSGYEALSAAVEYLSRGQVLAAWHAARTHAAIAPHFASTNVAFIQAVRLCLQLRLPGQVRTRLSSLLRRIRPRRSSDVDAGLARRGLVARVGSGRPTEHPEGRDVLNAELRRQVYLTSLPGILRKFDHAAMAHGIESRMPFLDYRLMTYSLALPIAQKVNRGCTKAVLRRAMTGLVPAEVLTQRRKQGFPIPPEWLRDRGLQSWIDGALASERVEQLPYWDPSALREWWQGVKEAGGTGPDISHAFRVASTIDWHRMNW